MAVQDPCIADLRSDVVPAVGPVAKHKCASGVRAHSAAASLSAPVRSFR
jgi:hypothetical protein